ncbi:MAG: threonine synthase, partial [Deltaproteobacteria bacterium]|nr:threonine synthase [Deltaproteobacteria bacterium]
MIDFRLECVTCGQRIDPTKTVGTCPDCGAINGTLDLVYDLTPGVRPDSLGATGQGMFRLLPLLPIGADFPTTTLRVGDTPLYDAPAIASRLGIRRLFIKDEGLNPSASIKDRATAVALAHAAHLGHRTVTTASTGNAASSLAIIAASMCIKAVIFVPRTAPDPKVAQMLLAGATVIRVAGTYDEAFDMAAEAAPRFGWYSRNTATNPYLAEGKKTCAIEAAEALHWEVPDHCAVGVGDGCVYAAMHKGFKELATAGLTSALPRMLGVQAQGCAPLARAFESGGEFQPIDRPDTYADSIAVGVPRDRVKALRAARESKGAIISVTDERIREAVRLLASSAGVFAEPAGAAGLAGLIESSARGVLAPDS